ncbi:MAG: hypothetical protein MI741_22345, partial [Rhodospirillales bacterium]|nr:hypothetical protein [Rhodospirillales bacterium]
MWGVILIVLIVSVNVAGGTALDIATIAPVGVDATNERVRLATFGSTLPMVPTDFDMDTGEMRELFTRDDDLQLIDDGDG